MNTPNIQQLRDEWINDWRKADFSWLGKALNDVRDPSSYNYSILRPPEFPGDGASWGRSKGITAKDYWRWSLGLPGPQRLLDDEELTRLGLLTEHNGTIYHLIHAPTLDKSNSHLDNMVAARAELTTRLRGEGEHKESLSVLHMDGAWLPIGIFDLIPDGVAVSARQACFESISFDRTLRALNCQRAWISDVVLMTNATVLGDIDFAKTVFAGDVWCDEMEIGGDARFGGCMFLGSADFSEVAYVKDASFPGAHFQKSANFSASACGKDFWLMETTFSGNVYCDGLRIGGKLVANRCKVHGPFDFRGSTSEGSADFSRTVFASDVSFAGAAFDGPCSFTSVTWPEFPIDEAFAETRFRDRANFQGEHFDAISALNHVTFDVAPAFPEPHDSLMFERQYRAACRRTRMAIQRDRSGREPFENGNLLDRVRTADQRWAALSGGYRTLKNIARDHGDFFLEQTYYRYEIKARMKRPKVSIWEKLVASVYSAVSDYGNSVARPFAALFIGLFVFSLIYFGIAVMVDPPIAKAPDVAERVAWQSWEFSWSNTFRPLSALSTEAPREGDVSRLAGRLMYDYGGAVSALVRGVATLQSLMGIVLAFLFALAVRRRFQIDA